MADMKLDLNLAAPAKGIICARCGAKVIRYASTGERYMSSDGRIFCGENGEPHVRTLPSGEDPVGNPNYYDFLRSLADDIGELVTGRVHPTIHDKVLAKVEQLKTATDELELLWEEENGD